VTVAFGNGTLRLEAAGPSLKLFYGPVAGTLSLVANGYDSAFTTGTSGVRLTKGSTIDNFALSAIVLTTPAVPSPTRSRRQWKPAFAGLDRALRPLPDNRERLVVRQRIGREFRDRQWHFSRRWPRSRPTLASAPSRQPGRPGCSLHRFGLLPGGHPEKHHRRTIRARIYKVVGSTLILLTDRTPSARAATAPCGWRSLPRRSKLYFGPVGGPLNLVATQRYAVCRAGTTGVRTVGSTVDNYTAAAISLLTPAVPFTDTFSQPNGTQLSLNWVNRQGNYTVQLGQLVGNDAS